MINHRYDGITVTTSAIAADMSGSMFAKHYFVIMPLIECIEECKECKEGTSISEDQDHVMCQPHW